MTSALIIRGRSTEACDLETRLSTLDIAVITTVDSGAAADISGPQQTGVHARPDIIFIDDAVDLTAWRRRHVQTRFIVVAAPGSIQGAVEAIRSGAADYVTPQTTSAALLAMLERFACRRATPRLIGECAVLANLKRQAERVAATNTPVLIRGESGTGKELLAHLVHSGSARAAGPMITLKCARIPPHLMDGELLGSIHGDGVLDRAEGGTLFLDEIGDLPLSNQGQILALLDHDTNPPGPPPRDIRLIAASHQDLLAKVKRGEFREDLYYRLTVFTLEMPPLRERQPDVRLLADWFLARSCEKLGREVQGFSTEARHLMERYPWPGNVRELQNAVERAVILSDGGEVSPDLLAIQMPEQMPEQHGDGTATGGFVTTTAATDAGSSSFSAVATDAQTSLEDYFVRFVLEHQDQLTETELAAKLGISRKSLWERRQRLGVPRKRTKKRGPRRDIRQTS